MFESGYTNIIKKIYSIYHLSIPWIAGMARLRMFDSVSRYFQMTEVTFSECWGHRLGSNGLDR